MYSRVFPRVIRQADVNAASERGFTALLRAAEGGHTRLYQVWMLVIICAQILSVLYCIKHPQKPLQVSRTLAVKVVKYKKDCAFDRKIVWVALSSS